jgi:beta-phosphoglucomutase-like phosphatase (HAD superfamily)
MNPPEAVLFDCDGVLVDSEGPTFRLFQAEFAAHGLTLTLAELERDWVGATAEGLAERARARGARLPDGWVAQFYGRLDALLSGGVPMIAGVGAVLDRLDLAGIPYAVGSNGPLRKMEITLGPHGLIRRTKGRIFSGQALGRPKPDPAVYLAAAEALGVMPSRAVVIEDSPPGAEAARRAGMRCYGYSPHGISDAGLAAAGARIFRDMAELPGLLGLG